MSESHHAVFGHPITHSLSPRIHARFSRQTGIALRFEAIDATPGTFATALEAFTAGGGDGACVTLPLKEAALALCSEVSDRARRAGAVNVLVRKPAPAEAGGDRWHGDNTDGSGLVRDLTARQGVDLRQRRTLLLGAGGAAHGVAPALIDAGIGDMFIVNRDSARADALVDKLGLPKRVHSRYYEDLRALGEFDLIINATSAARSGGLPTLPTSLVGARTACVDLSYGEVAIPFLAWARAAGARKAVDGVGMLVEQAADAFKLWHDVRPYTDEAYAALRERDALLVTGD